LGREKEKKKGRGKNAIARKTVLGRGENGSKYFSYNVYSLSKREGKRKKEKPTTW